MATCPNCGATIRSLTAECAACGAAFDPSGSSASSLTTSSFAPNRRGGFVASAVYAIPIALVVYVVAMVLLRFPNSLGGSLASQVANAVLKPAFFLIGKLLLFGPGFVHISGFIATYAWILVLVILLRSAFGKLGSRG